MAVDFPNLLLFTTSKIYLFRAETSSGASAPILGICLPKFFQLFIPASQHYPTSSTIPDILLWVINLKVRPSSEHSITGPLLYI